MVLQTMPLTFLGRNVNLLVISKDPKDFEVYLDADDEVNPPLKVDIMVVKLGQKLREVFIKGVLGASGVPI